MQVADPQHLAVAHVPERALQVADLGHAQTDRLDDTARLAEVDDVTHTVLVLDEHEDPGQEVLDERLGAEAERDPDAPLPTRAPARGPSPRCSRATVTATIADHQGSGGPQHRPHRLGALHAARDGQRVVVRRADPRCAAADGGPGGARACCPSTTERTVRDDPAQLASARSPTATTTAMRVCSGAPMSQSYQSTCMASRLVRPGSHHGGRTGARTGDLRARVRPVRGALWQDRCVFDDERPSGLTERSSPWPTVTAWCPTSGASTAATVGQPGHHDRRPGRARRRRVEPGARRRRRSSTPRTRCGGAWCRRWSCCARAGRRACAGARRRRRRGARVGRARGHRRAAAEVAQVDA